MKKVILEVAIVLAAALVIFFLLQTTLQSFVIVERCMEPNFHEGERILVNKVVYNFHEPERGDVIILHPPFNPDLVYIKRVIALPGDTVEVKDGAVYINGTRLDEPYAVTPTYTYPETTIPEDEYFVLGDNRNNANDSHRGWTVSGEDIIGKAWITFWPMSEWGVVDHYPLEEQLEGSSD